MAENTNTGFSIADLKSMLNLIQVVSARGAIKPNEMTAVGDLHDRLSLFLETVDRAAAQSKTPGDSGSTISTGTQGEANG